MITLINGRNVDEAVIAFDANTYHFTLRNTGEDVTNEIRRADKLALVSGFDIARDNNRLYAEKKGGVASGKDLEPLETNTFKIFGQQILNDPLAAPLETVDKGVKQIFASSGIQTLLVVAGLGIAALILLKK
jgi:hypothetical protein